MPEPTLTALSANDFHLTLYDRSGNQVDIALDKRDVWQLQAVLCTEMGCVMGEDPPG